MVGNPDFEHIGTTTVERHNLTMRMSMRRFARRTNAFSKLVERHALQVALYAFNYNFCRGHMSLSDATPAMLTGLRDSRMSLTDLVNLIDERTPPPRRPKRYRRRER